MKSKNENALHGKSIGEGDFTPKVYLQGSSGLRGFK